MVLEFYWSVWGEKCYGGGEVGVCVGGLGCEYEAWLGWLMRADGVLGEG